MDGGSVFGLARSYDAEIDDFRVDARPGSAETVELRPRLPEPCLHIHLAEELGGSG
jgi:hypothetical protein